MAESVVACNVLNQMTELGRPESLQYWSVTCRWVGIVDGQFRVMHQRRACGELDVTSVAQMRDGRRRIIPAHAGNSADDGATDATR